MHKAAIVSSFAYLLIGSAFFGYVGKPTEMALVIVASALALSFLNMDKIQRFKGAGFEAEMRLKLETIVEAQTEPAPRDRAPEKSELDLDDRTIKVLRALASPTYTWRYAGGLSEETSIQRVRLQTILDRLLDQGLVVFGQGKKGGSIWALSSEGRATVEALDPPKKDPQARS